MRKVTSTADLFYLAIKDKNFENFIIKCYNNEWDIYHKKDLQTLDEVKTDIYNWMQLKMVKNFFNNNQKEICSSVVRWFNKRIEKYENGDVNV